MLATKMAILEPAQDCPVLIRAANFSVVQMRQKSCALL